MSFMKGDLLSKARKLMKGGIMARPRWLDAVIRYPTEQLLYAAAVAVVADVAFFFSHNFCCCERIVERWVFVFFSLRNRVPPQPKKTRCHRAPNIKLPEDRLVESYYARHPEAKFIPFE
jgi:hypothetical protein